MIYGVEIGTKEVLNILHYQNFLRNVGLITKIKPNMTEVDFAKAMLLGKRKIDYKKLEEAITRKHEDMVFKASGLSFVAGVPDDKVKGRSDEEITAIIVESLSPITNKYFSDVWVKNKLTYINA